MSSCDIISSLWYGFEFRSLDTVNVNSQGPFSHCALSFFVIVFEIGKILKFKLKYFHLQDPAGIFDLVEVVGNGTYGQVHKVIQTGFESLNSAYSNLFNNSSSFIISHATCLSLLHKFFMLAELTRRSSFQNCENRLLWSASGIALRCRVKCKTFYKTYLFVNVLW